MSLQGPILVVSAQKDGPLLAALGTAGAFPVVEAAWTEAVSAVKRIQPAAILLPDPELPEDDILIEKVARAIGAVSEPFMPVIARMPDSGPAFPAALPIARNASAEQIIGRLASALRVRTLHATVLRRADSLQAEADDLPALPETDPLEDATVLVTGRGRTYPGLTTAVGERVGLIGALAVETAAKFLNARDIDGIVIGEGFGGRTIDAFLTALGDDSRFRDLPIALLCDLPHGVDRSRLPNLERLDGEPADIVERMLPLVRLHAFEARLQRQLSALEAKGMVDPQTGLFTIRAFLRDLDRAMHDARERGIGMSIARFSFPPTTDLRTSMDAARLVSRLVRSVDFACRASDGSILLVFNGTALRNAHVVARRIASVLRQTMLLSGGQEGRQVRVDPSVTLAALKANDTVESLLGRVNESSPAAA